MSDISNPSMCSTSQLLPLLMRQGRPVALVGMMGAGKTTVARQLSSILGLVCYDMDNLIEKKINCSISEYFADNDEIAFREEEAVVIGDYLDRGSAILALGGGAFIQDALRRQLLAKAWCVHLDVPLETLWQRVRQRRSSRPMIHDQDGEAQFACLYHQRAPIYAQAPLQVVWQDETSAETAQHIKQMLWHRLHERSCK